MSLDYNDIFFLKINTKSMDPKITLKFSREEIKERLKKTFKADHANVMAECIVGVLHDNEHAFEVILKATLGIVPELKYQIGDKVSVKKYAVSNWRFDEDKMNTEGYFKNEHITATIREFQLFKREQYTISYDYICKETGEIKSTTSDADEDYITGLVEEFPLDL